MPPPERPPAPHRPVAAQAGDEVGRCLAAVLEASGDLIAVVRLDGTVELLNDAGRDLLGWREDQGGGGSGPTSADLWREESRRLLLDVGLPAARREGRWCGEGVLLTRAGKEVNVAQTVRWIADEAAAPGARGVAAHAGRCVVVARAVMNARRATRVAEEWSGLFDRIFRASPDAIAVTHFAEGRILEVNPAFERWLGLAQGEVVGRTKHELGFWGVAADRERMVALLEKNGGSVREFLTLARDGRGRPRTCLLSVEAAEVGRRRCLVMVVRDITERVEAEQALTDSERKFQKAFQATPDALAITELASGRYIDVNQGYCQLLGHERAALIGRTSREINFWTSDADRDRFVEELRARGRVRGMEVRGRNGAGGAIVGLLAAELIQLGEVLCVVAVLHDVTERQRLEEQLRQAQKMESIGRLAGGIAHDFNNILTVIFGHVALLREEAERLSPRAAASLDQIERSAEMAANLTRQLLVFGRRQAFKREPLNLNGVVERVVRILERVLGDDIVCQPVLAPELPAVHADVGMIEQVIMNLAVNARDAMPAGGRIEISTRVVELDAQAVRSLPHARTGTFVCVQVRDTGTGIPVEILPRIFEPFFTTKPEGRGTGLGLATVYGIAQQHQGWIDVWSHVGEGSSFTLHLPAARRVAPLLTAPAVSLVPTRASGTVLLVEDQPEVRFLLRSLLERAGYRVCEASDGSTALELWKLRRGEIDLVLTDVVMPGGMNGREFATRIRADHAGIPVVFCSGHGAEVLEADFLARPENHFLSKPFTLDGLLSLVRAAIQAKTAPPGATGPAETGAA